MAVSVSCPQCHASFPVSAELLGKKMRCRGCQTVFVGQAATAKVAAGSSAAPRSAPQDSTYAEPRPAMDDVGKKSGDNTAMLAFVGIGTAVALMSAVTIWAVFFRGGANDDGSKNPVAVNNVSKINLGDTAKEEAAKKTETPKETPKVEKPAEKPKITVAKFDDAPKNLPFRIEPPTRQRVEKASAWIKVESEHGGGFGSGWMAEPGIVITNSHVVAMKDPSALPPKWVKVVFDSGLPSERTFDAKILGLDRENDLCVLRVEGENLPDPVPISRSSELTEGQHLYVVGYPRGNMVAKIFGDDKHTLETTVKVRQSTVVGRMPTKTGSIKLVQIEGGADPGERAGPAELVQVAGTGAVL